MKYSKWVAILTLAIVPTVAAAQLSSADKVVADVPFNFIISDTVMPSGECIVQLAGTVQQALLVRSPHAQNGVFALPLPDAVKQPAAGYSLVFHKYGHHYFLAGLKVDGSRTAYSFRPSKLELELRAQNVHGTEEIVLASLR